MKIFTCISSLLLFLTITLNAQINKGNWLVGGNASYSNVKTKDRSDNPSYTLFECKPDIGYFIIDKLAGGLILDVLSGTSKYTLPDGNINKNTQTTLGFGPFLRYYLLNADKMVNVFLSANLIRTFTFANTNSDHVTTSNSFSYEGAAGAVVFLNSSVGLEAAVGYNYMADIGGDNPTKIDKILFRLGFQIHLEKE